MGTAQGHIRITRKVKGEQGENGVSVIGVRNEYALGTSDTTAPSSGWQSAALTPTAEERYLWGREVTVYDNGTTSTSTPHLMAMYSEDGKGIVSVTEYYLASALSSGVTIYTSGWSTDLGAQQISEEKPYLWNYEEIVYTKGDPDRSTPVIIGRYGSDGADGADGNDGADGTDGADGADGSDAWEIRASPAVIPIATDADTGAAVVLIAGGNVVANRYVKSEITMFRGTEQAEITNMEKVSSDGTCNHVMVLRKDNQPYDGVYIRQVYNSGETVTKLDGSTYYIPYTDGTFTLRVTGRIGDAVRTMDIQISFHVSVTYMWSIMEANNQHFATEVGKIAEINEELVEMKSEIDQKADTVDITTLENDLETAGVHIKGSERKVVAVGEHFEVHDLDGAVTMKVDSDGNIIAPKGKMISGAVNGRRVEMDGLKKLMAIYDDDGTQVTTVDGSRYSSAKLVPGTGVTVYYPYSESYWFFKTYSACASSLSLDKLAYTLKKLEKAANIRIRGEMTILANRAKAHVDVYLDYYSEQPEFERTATNGNWYYMRTSPSAYLKKSELIASVRDADDSQTFSYNGYVEPGYFLVVRAHVALACTEPLESGAVSPQIEVRVQIPDGGVEFVQSQYNAKLFASGLAMTADSDNYFMMMYEEGMMNILSRSNGSSWALSKGREVVNGAIQPRLIFHGTVGGETLYDRGHANGITPSLAHMGTGKYKIKLTGAYIHSDSVFVVVNSFAGNKLTSATVGTPPTARFVGTMDDNSLLIYVTNAAGLLTDAQFTIDVFKVGTTPADNSVNYGEPVAAELDDDSAISALSLDEEGGGE